MKKIISIFLLLALLVSLAIPVQAISAKAVYTSDSSFQVGGTASIDTVTTRQNVMSDSGVTSDLYNAALEGNMSYHWVSSNGGAQKDGPSVTWTQADVGKEFYCQVAFYSDKDCAWYVDHIISEPVIIQDAAAAKLSPNGGTYHLTLNKPFQLQISCSVPVEEISNYMTPLPNGLSISKNGLITGTPTKEGFWYVTIAAWKGEDDVVADAGFEFYVSKEAVAEPEITTKSLPEATVGVAYSAKINSTDSKAEYGISYNPGGGNDFEKTGLTLSASGQISGTPKAAGTYSFTVCAAGEGGEGYMTYILTVKKAAEEETEPSTETQPGDSTEKPTKKPTSSKNQNNKETDDEDEDREDSGLDQILIYVGVGIGALIIILVLLLVLVLKRRKKNQ